ncbi:shikimate dehydrogenase [Corynebacterium sp. sy017]|uniref:shikimate dehydrogenase n=1 Tax=unclassified Corynebacterium TaxID=2624378 RepID=UPI001184FDA8|nr:MULTISPECIES: shikimate dehydrogenase [unclassified Corynebacterium]MBP3087700.1 shikimate dehydrogenase [Corynebacterium sp. sy017]QDZ42680.1 shikimate dehydrogenase [Corynebacterium sp. sy039]TSD92256.1 shikimate dehydrogenase [Corynebacterium sp. SY003]
MGDMHRVAVLGYPIEHSLSPIVHNAGYAALGLKNWHYDRYECTAEQLPGLVHSLSDSYQGFSVTMPAKFAALSFANTVSNRAQEIGSANTLVATENLGWYADNTDCEGIIGSLEQLGITRFSPGDRAVVIGGGGTARPTLWALAQLGINDVAVINRSDKTAELLPLVERSATKFNMHSYDEDLGKICSGSSVIISTVPSAVVARYAPQIVHAPLIDVIYDPAPTPLQELAYERAIPAVGGHVMLAYQAYSQFELFTGQQAPREVMFQALEQALGLR